MKVKSNRPGILWQTLLVFLIIMDGILLFLTVISPNLKITTLHNMGLFDLIVSIILLISYSSIASIIVARADIILAPGSGTSDGGP